MHHMNHEAEHSIDKYYIQSFNMLANVTLEKRWGSIMTSWQLFTSNFKAQRMNLHPFDEPGFVLIEKQSRDGKLGDVRERALGVRRRL